MLDRAACASEPAPDRAIQRRSEARADGSRRPPHTARGHRSRPPAASVRAARNAVTSRAAEARAFARSERARRRPRPARPGSRRRTAPRRPAGRRRRGSSPTHLRSRPRASRRARRARSRGPVPARRTAGSRSGRGRRRPARPRRGGSSPKRERLAASDHDRRSRVDVRGYEPEQAGSPASHRGGEQPPLPDVAAAEVQPENAISGEGQRRDAGAGARLDARGRTSKRRHAARLQIPDANAIAVHGRSSVRVGHPPSVHRQRDDGPRRRHRSHGRGAAPPARLRARPARARVRGKSTSCDRTTRLLAHREAQMRKVASGYPVPDAFRRLREVRQGPPLRRGPAREAPPAAGRVHRHARARLPEALGRGAARHDRRATRAARERRVARRAALRGVRRRARGALARVAAADVRRPDDGRDRPPRGRHRRDEDR